MLCSFCIHARVKNNLVHSPSSLPEQPRKKKFATRTEVFENQAAYMDGMRTRKKMQGLAFVAIGAVASTVHPFSSIFQADMLQPSVYCGDASTHGEIPSFLLLTSRLMDASNSICQSMLPRPARGGCIKQAVC